ncbi:MAG TPA: efflux RND transporter periplasmic adaptor subunit [Burkholderiaceae bacterium]
MENSKFLKRSALIAALGAVVLAACGHAPEKVEEVRPVRVMTLASSDIDLDAEFPGEVRARVESRLGFRVGGKIVARKVDVGNTVKRGQVLMQLDPQDLQLAQAQALAGLRASESNRDLARAELKRYQDLRDKNFVSQAVLDSKDTAYRSAQASYEQALAQSKTQSNQAAYTTLVADADGVVTGVDAEVGQVVAAGSPVVRVAQTGEKEIVIGIPEDKVDTLRRVGDVKVRVWAQPNDLIAGHIREISPIADPVTRTFTAKIAMPDAPTDVRLGMTAYVRFASKTAAPQIKVPLTALFQDKSGSAVWVVENHMAKLVPVQVGGASGNDVVLSGGVAGGQVVVTAGVNSLKPGQKVSILGEDATPKQAVAGNDVNSLAEEADIAARAGGGVAK